MFEPAQSALMWREWAHSLHRWFSGFVNLEMLAIAAINRPTFSVGAGLAQAACHTFTYHRAAIQRLCANAPLRIAWAPDR